MNRSIFATHTIGRHTQFDELERCLDRVRCGHGHLAMLAGEAGIGKTRLVRDFVQRLTHDTSVDVVQGQCYDEDPAVPYGPWIEVMQQLIQHHGIDAVVVAAGPWLGSVTRLLPALESVAQPATSENTPQLEQRWLFEAIVRIIRPYHDHQCRIIIIEDLHWSDQTSQELLHYLAHAIEHDRVLVIGTYRTDELHRRHPLTHLLVRLNHDRLMHEIRLAPLSRDEFVQMLTAIVKHELAASLVDLLYERTGGNPFFTEEIVKSLADNLPPDTPPHPNSSGLPHLEFELPTSVRDSVLRRTLDLDDRTMAVLMYAAIIGRSFDFELLLHLTSLTEADLIAALSLLVEHHMITEDTSTHDDRYRFRHELIREACYEDMLRRERRMKHRTVLRAIEELYHDRLDQVVDQLAYHSLHARALPQTIQYARLAGDRAVSMHAYREAVAHYEVALEAVEDGEVQERADLLNKLGHATYPLGDLKRCTRFWSQAHALYVQCDSKPRRAETLVWLARCSWLSGDLDTAVTNAHTALDTLQGEPATPELAMVYSTLSQFAMVASKHQESITWGEQALELAEMLGDERVKTHTLNNMGVSLIELGEMQRGLETLERSLLLARKADLVSDAIRAYMNLDVKLFSMGQFRRATSLMREGIDYARQVSCESDRAQMLGFLAWSEVLLGEWQQAQAHLDEAQQMRRSGVSMWLMYDYLVQIELMLRQGRTIAAYQLLEHIRSYAQVPTHAVIQRLCVLVPLALNDIEQAVAAADTIMQLANKHEIGPQRSFIDLALCIEAYVRAERIDQATDLLALLMTATSKTATPFIRAVISDAHGLIAGYRGHPDAADHFQQAANLWHAMETPLEEARSRRHRAACLLQSGKTALYDEALHELTAAQAIVEKLGALPDIEAIAALLQQPAVAKRSARRSRKHPYGLTSREYQVLKLLVQGLSNRDIADALVISEKTAEVHVSNILGKLRCTSRTQAATFALEHGLV